MFPCRRKSTTSHIAGDRRAHAHARTEITFNPLLGVGVGAALHAARRQNREKG